MAGVNKAILHTKLTHYKKLDVAEELVDVDYNPLNLKIDDLKLIRSKKTTTDEWELLPMWQPNIGLKKDTEYIAFLPYFELENKIILKDDAMVLHQEKIKLQIPADILSKTKDLPVVQRKLITGIVITDSSYKIIFSGFVHIIIWATNIRKTLKYSKYLVMKKRKETEKDQVDDANGNDDDEDNDTVSKDEVIQQPDKRRHLGTPPPAAPFAAVAPIPITKIVTSVLVLRPYTNIPIIKTYL